MAVSDTKSDATRVPEPVILPGNNEIYPLVEPKRGLADSAQEFQFHLSPAQLHPDLQMSACSQ